MAKRWSYSELVFKSGDLIEWSLNEYGMAGWELVTILPIYGSRTGQIVKFVAYLKREQNE